MSTHNKGFNEDLTKIIFQLSSNTHLISSSVCYLLALREYVCGTVSSILSGLEIRSLGLNTLGTT